MKKRTSRKRNKQKVSKRTVKKNKTMQIGGDGFKTLLLGMLSDRYIPFLPSTRCVADKQMTQTYLYSVSAYQLLKLIGKYDKFTNSPSISKLIEAINVESEEMFRELGGISEIPVSRKIMSNFIVNCSRMSYSKSEHMKKLHSYVLDCEDFLSLKNVNWYKVALGLIPLDNEFESAVLAEIRDKHILIDTEIFKYGLKLLLKDDSVREVFKKRILDCSYKPQGFFDRLFGTISWDSYNECFKCSDNSCVVELDSNYKSFLNKKHNIKTVDKIKILVYAEIRLRAMSKHFALEGLRISDNRLSKVKTLLNKIQLEDKRRYPGYTNDKKQRTMKRIQSGGVELAVDPNVQVGEAKPLVGEAKPLVGEAKPLVGEAKPLVSPFEPVNPVTPAPAPAPAPLPAPAPAVEPAPLPAPAPAVVPTPMPAVPAVAPMPMPAVPAVVPAPAPQKEESKGLFSGLTNMIGFGDKNEKPEPPKPEPPKPEPPKPDRMKPTEDSPLTEESDKDIPFVPQVASAELPERYSANRKPFQDSPEDSPVPKSSHMIYVTYGLTNNELEINDSIVDQLLDNFMKITKVSDPDKLKLYRTIKGPQTVSFDIGIEQDVDDLSSDIIKQNIATAIADKKISEQAVIFELNELKDIQFDGISKFSELNEFPSQFKRASLEMLGQFPDSEKDKFNLERNLLLTLYEVLEKEVDIERIQIESISRQPMDEEKVIVQFSIMNSHIEKMTPDKLLKKLKERYGDGTTEFAQRFGISKLVFKDPVIVFGTKPSEISDIFQKQTELVGETENTALAQFEGKFPRHSYYGCDLVIEQLKNGRIVDPNLQIQCENSINTYLGSSYE